MIISEINAFISFGTHSLSVGPFQVENEWCISIRELRQAIDVEPGASLDIKTTEHTGNRVVLSFPTENQMIAVLAALTNQSFEVIDNKWKAAKANTMEWVVATEDIE